MTAHPGKSEAMIIKRGTFVGPLTLLWFNGKAIKSVKSARILGLTLDAPLKWKEHTEQEQLSYAWKLNLSKTMRFLSRQMLNNF